MRTAVAQYYARPSLIHGLDARCKVVAVTALVIGLFLRSSFAALAVYGLAAAAGLLLSGVPLGWIARGLRPVLWLLVLTFIVQLLFAPGPAFYSLGPLHLSQRGLAVAGYLCLRLVVLVVASLLLTLTTAPLALTDALAWLGRPLRRLRVPTEELALMVTIALRFIPTLLQEIDTIMKAQRARGASFNRGGPLRRARALMPVLVPLFILSFRRADELALAMEARCYLPGAPRTRLHPLRARRRDAVLLVLVAAIVVLAELI
jgi:energy-coupling factor transport system permease protein